VRGCGGCYAVLAIRLSGSDMRRLSEKKSS
jgi:hypothetical protein